jgi:adenylate cyclase
MSGDKEQDYFADGVTDDLTTDLSQGKPVDAKQIGRELGVRYVPEGSVRRASENITVNAQLISTETGAHVWAGWFDGERGKLGQLQVDFVAGLANSLGVELVPAEALRGMRERPDNPDAVDRSMRGWAECSITTALIDEPTTPIPAAIDADPGKVSQQGRLEILSRRRLRQT